MATATLHLLLTPGLALAASGSAVAPAGAPAGAPIEEALKLSVADAWARAAYAIPKEDRFATFFALAERARKEADKGSAASLIWKGICISTLAGEKRGLGSLKLVREARTALLASIELDETALEGAAHISLGALYYKLPPWPVSFGSKKRARRFLTRALEISPNSIDANYFMADFLFTVGDLDGAREHIETGLATLVRAERVQADQGRQDELKRLLERIESSAD